MVDVSDVWIDGVCKNDNYAGGDINFPMDWVCPNGVWTGHVGHVRLWWGCAQWLPEVGW